MTTRLLLGGPGDGYRVSNYDPSRAEPYCVAWQDSVYFYAPSEDGDEALIFVGWQLDGQELDTALGHIEHLPATVATEE